MKTTVTKYDFERAFIDADLYAPKDLGDEIYVAIGKLREVAR